MKIKYSRLLVLTFIGFYFLTNNIYSQNIKFEISFPKSSEIKRNTGRAYLIVTKNIEIEPRMQVGGWKNGPPLFGIDVKDISSDSSVLIEESTPGYPLHSLKDIPAGYYYVQALFNIYTKFNRSDGHTIWAHMDQWEGQKFNRSPGNLYSEVKHIYFDPEKGFSENLILSKVVPPIVVPNDTEWVKRIKIKSELLSKFWGHPIYLGATVLLPKGYNEHPEVHYPVHYIQDHFNLSPPNGFRTEEPVKDDKTKLGYEFYKAWNSDNYPRMICVTFQHPTPFYDDSYAVNSANNGPFGDAIISELISEIETKFRIIRKPYARILSGGSTGGWEALALQVNNPDFFGGAWVFYPDQVDFSRYGLVNLYEDENAFVIPHSEWRSIERIMHRDAAGQPKNTLREVSRFESVLGSNGRSGQQLAIWEAVFGPVGEGGYPKPVWDVSTGVIDHSVVQYMKDNGYDLRYYMEENWSSLGPKLVGKLHFACGDMDDWLLNLGLYKLEEFLENTTSPYYDGSFEYGRPMKGHGWRPIGDIELIKVISEYIIKTSPKEALPAKWIY